jgi:hypothetical protein
MESGLARCISQQVPAHLEDSRDDKKPFYGLSTILFLFSANNFHFLQSMVFSPQKSNAQPSG